MSKETSEILGTV